MANISSFKSCLTIEGAADFLSTSLNDKVSAVDVLQLGLDQKFKISVQFPSSVDVRRFRTVPFSQLDWIHTGEDPDFWRDYAQRNIEPQHCYTRQRAIKPMIEGKPHIYGDLDDQLTTIEGLWDLPPFGDAYRALKLQLAQLLRNIPISLKGEKKFFVIREERVVLLVTRNLKGDMSMPITDGQIKELMAIQETEVDQSDPLVANEQYNTLLERRELVDRQRERQFVKEHYTSADQFPPDSYFVVKRTELENFVLSLNSPTTTSQPEHSSFNSRKYATLQKLILGMAIDAYSYKPGENRQKATGTKQDSISSGLERCGLNLDCATIKKHLEEAVADLGFQSPNPHQN